ncbi:MAG: polyprenyl synthetase family protein [Thermoplasmata archaeon]|jgi:geranylgeranyl pyrophosphate synthase|nr:polyprenyl synthetase family protein [Thermoplasmata archaeon]
MPLKSRTITFQEFFREVQEEVWREIEHNIHDEDMLYALEGGKMLRPAMLMLSFRACDGADEYYRYALESAMGMELAHSASLIHDDIMDGDDERRGKLALHVVKGLGTAILTGHKMISTAFRISLSHGMENAWIFLNTWEETLIGQLKDIDLNAHLEDFLNGHEPEKLLQEYFKIIEMKTASLFATACRAGAIEAKANEELRELMRLYGREVGMAYQLADDLVDIANGKLEEGIIIPLIRAYGKNIRRELLEMLKENGTHILEEVLSKNGFDLKKVYLEEIRKRIASAVELASSPLIPDTPYKELLKEAPAYIVNAMISNVDMVV